MGPSKVGALILLGLSTASCESAPSEFGPGLELQLRVTEAQLIEGTLHAGAEGPPVTQVIRQQPEVRRGEATVRLSGRLGAEGVVLNVQAEGDDKYWQIRADGFDFVVSDELLWGAELQFSHSIKPDVLPVLLQAVNRQGQGGPIEKTSFTMVPDVPPSELLVSLGWDSPVDLDLYVETPDGTIIGTKNINSYEPLPGQVPLPDAWMDGGFIEYDSNQECRLDLRNREDVVWLRPPPLGTYRVYANLFSPCEQASVNFAIQVQRGDTVTDEGFSTLYAFDARQHPAPGEAPGLLVLEFEVE